MSGLETLELLEASVAERHEMQLVTADKLWVAYCTAGDWSTVEDTHGIERYLPEMREAFREHIEQLSAP